MKAVLYLRLSAADVGVTPEAALAELRRYVVEVRGWSIVAEICDPGPWPDRERPGLLALTAGIRSNSSDPDAGEKSIDVLVTPSLARLVRHLRHLVTFAALLRDQQVEIVAIKDLVDTTDLAGGLRWKELVDTLTRIDREQRSEASKVAHVRAALKDAGDGFGRPPALINPLELLGYYHGDGTKARPPLSQRQIAKKLGHGERTIAARLRELREAGKLDEDLRQRNLKLVGGFNRGGRPSKARPIPDDELLSLYHGGKAKAVIAKYYRTSKSTIDKHLTPLLAGGQVDESLRAKNKARRKA